jgi:hypothetical protein
VRARSLCLVASTLPAAREPSDTDPPPLPHPVIVATITTDRRFTGSLNPSKLLARLAAQCGLLTYTIVDADAADLPGHQFELFAPVADKR